MSETIETKTTESASLAKLADALAKAQGMMGAAKKDAKNPHFGSSYADLASVWDAIREPLSKNGLSVVQRATTDPNGVTVRSRLIHVSGEWVEDQCWLPVEKRTPQGFGSAITYARRYSLSALIGVAAEDDDGNEAEGRGQNWKKEPPKKQTPARQAKAEEMANAPLPTGDATHRMARAVRLWKTAKQRNPNETAESFRRWAKSVLGVDFESKDWTEEHLDVLERAQNAPELDDVPM